MSDNDIKNLGSFVWSIAELLRGDFKQYEYGKVVLPFVVLRRLNCILEATKPDVLEMAVSLPKDMDDEARHALLSGVVDTNKAERQQIPDFIVVTDRDENVIVEIKGQVTDDADAKSKAAEQWLEPVNRLGEHGVRIYLLVVDLGRLGIQLNAFTGARWDDGPLQLT